MPLLKDGSSRLSDEQCWSALTEQAQGACVHILRVGSWCKLERQEGVRNKGADEKGAMG